MGKSCLSLQATKKKFENNYLATVGFEFFAFNIRIDGKVVKLQIWDTCGQEEYRSLIQNFYRNASLAIIVYSIDNMNSFTHLETWQHRCATQATYLRFVTFLLVDSLHRNCSSDSQRYEAKFGLLTNMSKESLCLPMQPLHSLRAGIWASALEEFLGMVLGGGS